MDPDFWHDRWRNAQIGFHQPRPNEKLITHWPELGSPAASPVFVPLCGKSLDMVWLAERGHRVIGIELSEVAIDEFFKGQNLTPETRQIGFLRLKSAGPYKLYCGDYFAMSPELLDGTRTIYDRAALIALPPEMRRSYTAHLDELFGATYVIDECRRDEDISPPPKFIEAGIETVTVVAYLLQPRTAPVAGETD